MPVRYICDECGGEMMAIVETQLVSFRYNGSLYEIPPGPECMCVDCWCRVFIDGDPEYHCNPMSGGVLRLSRRLGK
jgi:hypothetical protein